MYSAYRLHSSLFNFPFPTFVFCFWQWNSGNYLAIRFIQVDLLDTAVKETFITKNKSLVIAEIYIFHTTDRIVPKLNPCWIAQRTVDKTIAKGCIVDRLPCFQKCGNLFCLFR